MTTQFVSERSTEMPNKPWDLLKVTLKTGPWRRDGSIGSMGRGNIFTYIMNGWFFMGFISFHIGIWKPVPWIRKGYPKWMSIPVFNQPKIGNAFICIICPVSFVCNKMGTYKSGNETVEGEGFVHLLSGWSLTRIWAACLLRCSTGCAHNHCIIQIYIYISIIYSNIIKETASGTAQEKVSENILPWKLVRG